MLFLIPQIKRFGTLNTTQKRQPSKKHRSWKNQEKLPKNSQNTFFVKNNKFLAVILIFSRTVLCRGLRFFALRSVSQNAYFQLSKTTFGNIFIFFTISGVPYGQFFRRFKITKGIQIALLVQKLRRFCWMGDFAFWWSLSGGGSSINEATPSEYYTRYNNIIDIYNRASRLVIVQMDDINIQSKYCHKSVLHKSKYYVKTNQHVKDTNTNWEREKLCDINRRQSNTHVIQKLKW